jgi:GT2 family glycosyltransferase
MQSAQQAMGEPRAAPGSDPRADEWQMGCGQPLEPHRQPTAPQITVIVPVFNAVDELRRCLHSLQVHTTRAARLLLIDDASTEPEIGSVLAGACKLAGIEVLHNHQNQGFTASVNRGIRSAGGDDVVILNSDTVVTPRWLERLSVTAYQDPLVATVTAVSDNAGAFSVPEIGVSNPTPAGFDYDETSRAIAQRGDLVRPRTPTGSGFCLYIKRAALDEVGILDETAFPRGYGEENDFCMRALSRGWHHVVDDGVFIHHEREASFGAEKQLLMETGRSVVNRRHPQYTALVREFVTSEDMTRARTAIRRTYDEMASLKVNGRRATPRIRPRLLSVVHEGRGGTTATNFDLCAGFLSPGLSAGDQSDPRWARNRARAHPTPAQAHIRSADGCRPACDAGRILVPRLLLHVPDRAPARRELSFLWRHLHRRRRRVRGSR